LFDTVQGSGKLIQERAVGTPRQVTETSIVEFARKPGMFKISRRETVGTRAGEGSNAPERADGAAFYNRTMSARLEKKRGASSYVVVSTGGADLRDRAMISARFAEFLDCPFTLAGPRISEYLSKPNFNITRVDEVNSDGKLLLRIHFKNKVGQNPSIGGRVALQIDDGWLLVSPQESWVLYEAEVRFTSADGQTAPSHLFSVVYNGSHMGTPVPKKAQLKTVVRMLGSKKEMTDKRGRVLRDGAVTAAQTVEFDRISFDEPPDGDFALPAFGLPDLGKPRGPVARSSSIVWIFATAGVALVLAALLKTYASRIHATRKPEKPT